VPRLSSPKRGFASSQRFALIAFGALFLALFLFFALSEGIGAPEVPAGKVAVVDEVPGDVGQITTAQFRAAFAQVVAEGGQGAPAAGSEFYEQAKTEAMGRLIKAAWVTGEATERGVSVDAQQVDAAIAGFKQQQRYTTAADFKRFLSASKLTLTEFRQLARLQLLSGRVQEDAIETPAPSESAVEDYYEAAKALQFTTAPTYNVRLILNTDRAKVERTKAELQKDDAPATWERLASRYSEDPSGKKTGGLHRAIPTEFGEPLDAAIAAAPEGQVEGLVKVKGVYFVFEVEGSNPGEVEPLEKVRPNIVNLLTKQDREAALEEFAFQFETKWTSRTHCAEGYVVEGCAGYRGDGRLPNAPSACYEVHPKAGIVAPSCPAPVAQAAPAMPGTVSVLTPKGVALPQRPVPPPAAKVPAATEGLGQVAP
jgi:parvulin-like peptidyl-prolyl isomerase